MLRKVVLFLPAIRSYPMVHIPDILPFSRSHCFSTSALNPGKSPMFSTFLINKAQSSLSRY